MALRECGSYKTIYESAETLVVVTFASSLS